MNRIARAGRHCTWAVPGAGVELRPRRLDAAERRRTQARRACALHGTLRGVLEHCVYSPGPELVRDCVGASLPHPRRECAHPRHVCTVNRRLGAARCNAMQRLHKGPDVCALPCLARSCSALLRDRRRERLRCARRRAASASVQRRRRLDAGGATGLKQTNKQQPNRSNGRKPTRRSCARLASFSDSRRCATKRGSRAAVVLVSRWRRSARLATTGHVQCTPAHVPPKPPGVQSSASHATAHSSKAVRACRQVQVLLANGIECGGTIGVFPFGALLAHTCRENIAQRYTPTSHGTAAQRSVRAGCMLPVAFSYFCLLSCVRLSSVTSLVALLSTVVGCMLRVACCVHAGPRLQFGLRCMASVATLSFASRPLFVAPARRCPFATLQRFPLQRRQLRRLNGAHSRWRRAVPAFRRAAADRAWRGAL
jgi:hypothetical protein